MAAGREVYLNPKKRSVPKTEILPPVLSTRKPDKCRFYQVADDHWAASKSYTSGGDALWWALGSFTASSLRGEIERNHGISAT